MKKMYIFVCLKGMIRLKGLRGTDKLLWNEDGKGVVAAVWCGMERGCGMGVCGGKGEVTAEGGGKVWITESQLMKGEVISTEGIKVRRILLKVGRISVWRGSIRRTGEREGETD